jgi:alkylated DNA repair protein (DNA oxidative demethylase)
MRSVVEEPEGLVYRPDFLTEDEEQQLLEAIEGLDFREVRMRGEVARRTVLHFGFDYDYETPGRMTPAEPLPAALAWLRDRCAELAEVGSEQLAQALISRYPPGAGIGWHRDAPMFGPTVVGVSLASPARMRFRRTAGGVRWTYELALAPRSAYVLGGKARSAWQHSIPPTKALRYSVTFRIVRETWVERQG